jgi:ATP-dependent protease ClpP protease subunit
MYAIYDAIRTCNSKIICIGTGHVASAATLLLVAGDESYCTRHTVFMAHEGDLEFEEAEAISPQSLVADLAQDMEQEKLYCKLMSDHTKPTLKWWHKYAIESKKSIWMDTDDMIDKEIVKAEWPIT